MDLVKSGEQTFDYTSSELELFKHADIWKKYLCSKILPHLGQTNVEMGAGMGEFTLRFLKSLQTPSKWIAVEPDARFCKVIEDQVRGLAPATPHQVQVMAGTSRTIDRTDFADAILYIDVLEHILDDHEEVQWATRLLRPGGKLIVLCPAHQFLYSAFDKAIGHHRRYSRSQLLALQNPQLKKVSAKYLDSFGMIASLGNRLVTKQSSPTLKQILFWDRTLVPVSKILDPLLGFNLGKSVLVVWQKI